MKLDWKEILGLLEEAEHWLVGRFMNKKVTLDFKEMRISFDVIITDFDDGDDYIKLFKMLTDKK